MEETEVNPDHLKSLEDIYNPDPRNGIFARHFGAPGSSAQAIDMHYADVDAIKLAPSVPEVIRVQFETSKNLYLYAWFVYRFYNVAEHHALTCLELGLRERFPCPLPQKYWKIPGRKPTLHPLLRFAIDSGVLQNEGFRVWNARVERRARERHLQERIMEMIEQNLDQIEVNHEQAVPNDQDRDWNYLAELLNALPQIRNSYAHGSTMLHNQVLGTLELTSEILNQLFPTQPMS